MRIRLVRPPDELSACRAIRRAVFILEQAVSEADEWDGLDAQCLHFVAELDGRPVGTARLRTTADGEAKAQRVAVLAACRGRGVGAALMAALEAEAWRRGHRRVILGAQVQAVGFYERCGYRVFGEPFDDAGIPHRWMGRDLPAR